MLAGALVWLVSCSGGPGVPPDNGWGEGLCGERSEELGILVCTHRVEDSERWEQVTVTAQAIDQVRTGKWLMGAQDDFPLEPLFANPSAYALHSEMLAQAFGDLFPNYSQLQYSLDVLGDPPVIFSGDVSSYIEPDGSVIYGFTMWDDPGDPATTVTYEEVLQAWLALRDRFEIGALTWVPISTNQRSASEGWDPAFSVRGESDIVYEAYTTGVGYGSLRFHDLEGLAEAEADAAFGYQDILVLDEAPMDVQRVVSGFVTGSRQGQLSHLNVRSASRGTPNCYIKNPHEALAAYQDALVRFECGDSGWSVELAELDDAEAWWEALRPDPVVLRPPDLDTVETPGLLELDTSDSSARALGVDRYGSKGANLATMYQRIPRDLQLDGFLVPFHFYDAFMRQSTWSVDLGEGEGDSTFAETLEVWLEDEDFLSNGALRLERLEALQDAIEDAPKDPELVDLLATRVDEVYGDTTTMVRFRSSSNAEDALAFNGAGLYDSTSVCVADSLDDDSAGPSLCDPDKDSERSIERGLGKVWSSLWAVGAYEERDWYGMDHSQVAMGVLVNTRSKDEQVNIVAFTGLLNQPDDRYLINAQVGWLDVVSSEPGIWPETTYLDVVKAQVVDIERASESSESEEVLSDARLEELGAGLWRIEVRFPVDELPEEGDVLLDTEWKVLEDGRLIVKQVRPFVR